MPSPDPYATILPPPAPPTAEQHATIEQSPHEAAKATEVSDLSTTRTLPAIPGYHIERELGRGGMGVVYKARQLLLNRPMAIKMLLDGHYAEPLAQMRFFMEAEVVGQIQHPNVVQVFEFGQHQGQPFFVLEFVAGGNLGEKLHTVSRFPPRAAAEMVAKVADGIAAAHAKGIVHRDLKPANVMLDESGEPKVTDFGLAKIGNSEMTASGAIMGTPSYMSPEQAAGRTREIGTTTDVYALGAILYELLTGQPPFKGDSVMETIHEVLTREPIRPTTIEPGVPQDLETICLKCLAKEQKRRYGTADALALDLRAYLDGSPITARPVGNLERVLKWAKRHPGRATVVAALLLIVMMAVAGAFQVQRTLVHQEVVAEKKRLDDLSAADEVARMKQRELRAESLVQTLATAETAEVQQILKALSQVRELAHPKLAELARQPVNTRPGLHSRLALLAEEPERAKDLAAYLPVCEVDELLTIRQLLLPHAASVAPAMWALLHDVNAGAGQRVRAACALAGLSPGDERWPRVAERLSEAVVRAAPNEFVVWVRALEPVRGHLVPALMRRYPESRSRIESGKLAVSELIADASAFDLTANMLAQYTADRPEDLAELAMMVGPRHYKLFAETITGKHRVTLIPILKAELQKTATPDWSRPGDATGAVAAVVGVAPLANLMNPDPVIDAMAKRKANAAAVLYTLGEVESVWPLFARPEHADPSVRSYLIQRLGSVGAVPGLLVRRFASESDPLARRAFLITLGDFPPGMIPSAEREAFVARLLVLYRDEPDPGLHSAIDWLLRQRWGKSRELDALDSDMVAVASHRVGTAKSRLALSAVVGSGLARASSAVVGARKDWFMNGEGQTYAIVRGPVAFMMGSPVTEPGRFTGFTDETQHQKRITRTFAVSTREVTNAEFLRFRPNRSWITRFSPDADGPSVGMTWYGAVAYCNWLSEQEGIPKDQWCYEPNEKGVYGKGMKIRANHLGLGGYRLPTEAEWEYVARAGAVTARFYGRGDELLSRYAWGPDNSDNHTWTTGLLRPNPMGMFDILGNADEWVEDLGVEEISNLIDDTEGPHSVVEEDDNRVIRGGSILSIPVFMRSANRDYHRPGSRDYVLGFRTARTLP